MTNRTLVALIAAVALIMPAGLVTVSLSTTAAHAASASKFKAGKRRPSAKESKEMGGTTDLNIGVGELQKKRRPGFKKR